MLQVLLCKFLTRIVVANNSQSLILAIAQAISNFYFHSYNYKT